MCECIAGFFEDAAAKTCKPCHPNCDLCEDPTKKCSACKNNIYRYLDLYCEDFCPWPYQENFGVNGSLICDYLIDNPPYNKACNGGFYRDPVSGNCINTGVPANCQTYDPVTAKCTGCMG